jgi:hypothetical protein
MYRHLGDAKGDRPIARDRVVHGNDPPPTALGEGNRHGRSMKAYGGLPTNLMLHVG